MNLTNPTLLVIVGITGNLSSRRLLPALYQLERENMINDLKIIGTTRGETTTQDLHHQLLSTIRDRQGECDETALNRLMDKLEVVNVDMSDRGSADRLNSILEQAEMDTEQCLQNLFYLAIPPAVFTDVATLIGESGLAKCLHGTPSKLLVEKPFGRDLKSAEDLADKLCQHFKEEQIYRIDHYLAKETAQNITHFRFNNPLVHDLWSSKFIDHIQITVAEEIDIEGRVNFYEQTGALRDIVQSHLLQLMALITMKKPENFNAECVRKEKLASLTAIRPIDVGDQVVFGQYAGYKEEVNNPDSTMETFVAMKLELDNQQWQNIPIYLRTGKALETKTTEINIIYKDPALKDSKHNVLTFKLQPNEGIALKLQAKKPGLTNATQNVVMDYCYERSGHEILHDAYQKLLIDAMNGDQTLFPSSDEVVASWQAIEPLIQSSKQREVYEKGSWGPALAAELLNKDRREWLEYDQTICRPHYDSKTD